jgi:hypothetical protein
VSIIIVAIFPNDISGLSCFDELERGSKEYGLFPTLVLKRVSDNLTVLFLEGNKSIDGSYKRVLLSLLEFKYKVLDFAGLIVSIEHDMITTLLQQHDHLIVIKGEDNIGYFHLGDIDSVPLWLEILNVTLSLGFSFGFLILFLKFGKLHVENIG